MELARQLEFKGDFATALRVFETALTALQDRDVKLMGSNGGGSSGSPATSSAMSPHGRSGGSALVVSSRNNNATSTSSSSNSSSSEEMQGVALAGIARCTLRLGDLRRGLR